MYSSKLIPWSFCRAFIFSRRVVFVLSRLCGPATRTANHFRAAFVQCLPQRSTVNIWWRAWPTAAHAAFVSRAEVTSRDCPLLSSAFLFIGGRWLGQPNLCIRRNTYVDIYVSHRSMPEVNITLLIRWQKTTALNCRRKKNKKKKKKKKKKKTHTSTHSDKPHVCFQAE